MNVFDKTKGNLSHQPVEVEFLRLGVFVAELDRPWLGTPFLLQGFLIDDEAQIRQLQALCRLVYVDRRRSIGDQYVAMIRERDRRRLALGALDDDEFLAVARRLRAGMADDEARRKARPLGETGLEEELLYSAPVIEDVQRTLATIRETISSGATVDLARVCDLVDELAAGVERNPDAMLWLTRLKATDQYSSDHAIDVSVLLMVFGRFLGLGRDAVGELGRAGLMQDIGKIHVSSDILAKEEPLSDVEFREIQSHVASSLELLVGQSGFSRTVLSIVAEHHERYDGSGYPRSIGIERISLAAEMSGLVDTYCAMTRDRVFSPAISSQGALEAICRLRGVKFRDAIVDQFVQCVGLYPIGTMVELNSGEVAIVIEQNRVLREKPRLMILLSAEKRLLQRPRYVDLKRSPPAPDGEPYRVVKALPPNAYGIDPAEFFLE